MEQFTAITLEVYLSGAWVNITSDVMAESTIKGNKGIMGNNPEDRVADPGKLTFTLDNSTGNSAGLLGYYSPGHANCRTGWTTGVPVRLSFEYKGFKVYKFRGRIEPDGITVAPGSKLTRKVEVRCYDYFGLLAYQKLNLLEPQAGDPVGVLATDAIADVIENTGFLPMESSYTGSASMTYVFDNLSPDQSALSEINKLAMSNRVYVYMDDGHYGELFTVNNAGSSQTIPNITAVSFLLLENGDNLLLENGDEFLLDETEELTLDDSDLGASTSISFGKDVINHVTMTTYPREIDAAATSLLWELQSADEIPGLSSIEIYGTYKDPNGGNTKINAKDWVNPLVSGTDYKATDAADGTGVDRTANMSVVADFGAAEVKLTITNSHASSIYTGGKFANQFLKVRGKVIRLYDPSKAIAQDATSIATHGKRPATIDMRYARSAGDKGTAATAYLNTYKDPLYSVDKLDLFANRDEKNMYAFMFAKVLTGPLITEAVTGLEDNRFYMTGYDYEVSPGKDTVHVRWYPIYRKNT
jgi:hypothetical protein